MSRLCFGSFATILKDCGNFTNQSIAEILIKGLCGEDTVDYSDKNKLVKSQIDKQFLKDAAKTKKVIDSIENYFKKEVVNQLFDIKITQLIEQLKGVIIGDETIYEESKKELLSNCDRTQLAKFLSKIFLFAATQPNTFKGNKLPLPMVQNLISISADGNLYLNGEKIILPKELVPSNNIENCEQIYIEELLKAYADAEKVEKIEKNNIPKKYLQHFEDQRRYFYSAEAINRSVRDLKIDNQFETFLQDTYDSVIDVCYQTHANGYEKLLKVLQQAANRPQGKSILEKAVNWIGVSEKKGACHILVNNKQIKWVVENE